MPQDNDTPLQGVSHEQLLTAIESATKEKMIHALRAMITSQLWEATDEDLRDALHNAAHAEGDQFVYNALVNGA